MSAYVVCVTNILTKQVSLDSTKIYSKSKSIDLTGQPVFNYFLQCNIFLTKGVVVVNNSIFPCVYMSVRRYVYHHTDEIWLGAEGTQPESRIMIVRRRCLHDTLIELRLVMITMLLLLYQRLYKQSKDTKREVIRGTNQNFDSIILYVSISL